MKKKPLKIIKLIMVVTAMTLTASLVTAQGNVNFSGKWKLNESKSKYNTQYRSAPMMVTVTQAGNSMSVERVFMAQGKELKETDQLTLDGKECKNKGFQGSEKISHANWGSDGNSLIIDDKVNTPNGEMTMNKVLKMDGSNLVLDMKVKGPWGESDETWVFDKQ